MVVAGQVVTRSQDHMQWNNTAGLIGQFTGKHKLIKGVWASFPDKVKHKT